VPASKAQQKAVNKYMAANYDRINLTVEKGKRTAVKIFMHPRVPASGIRSIPIQFGEKRNFQLLFGTTGFKHFIATSF